MQWNRRKHTATSAAEAATTSDLPVDYLRLMEETLNTALEPGLVEIRKFHPTSVFQANGVLFEDEVILAATLFHGESALAATTVYASADFDTESLQKRLAACLDAIGSIFDFYLDTTHPERIEQLAHHSIASLEEAPFEWTAVQHEIDGKIPVWVKMDKANPMLEKLTDQWLKENDPELRSAQPQHEDVLAEEFLEERLDHLQKFKGNGGGAVTH